MGQERLIGIALMYIHYSMNIYVDEAIDKYAIKQSRIQDYIQVFFGENR